MNEGPCRGLGGPGALTRTGTKAAQSELLVPQAEGLRLPEPGGISSRARDTQRSSTAREMAQMYEEAKKEYVPSLLSPPTGEEGVEEDGHRGAKEESPVQERKL